MTILDDPRDEELRKLRAKVEAAEELVAAIDDGTSWDRLYEALAAYKEAGE